ncbi:hypothetical protein OG226_50950 [Streptomyces sp. NBC_01261]|uniref:hypothetical protein n=1 Tax=Streptomyces sp. NBC_01261 TaxID=2903802 RepID=UPI002E309FCB|nr:hypothetical protein [Streptomyces sp. NBC_01261]
MLIPVASRVLDPDDVTEERETRPKVVEVLGEPAFDAEHNAGSAAGLVELLR